MYIHAYELYLVSMYYIKRLNFNIGGILGFAEAHTVPVTFLSDVKVEPITTVTGRGVLKKQIEVFVQFNKYVVTNSHEKMILFRIQSCNKTKNV